MGKTKIALLGKGRLAKQIAEWFYNSDQYELVYVVPVFPEPIWDVSLNNWCQENKINTYDDYRKLPDGIDLIFSCFYDKIIKKDFIDKYKKVINLHNAPLPKYRGVNPINWALKNNEKVHGITIHEIAPGIDDGAILSQMTYSIFPDAEEVKDVYNKALEYGYVLFKSTAPYLMTIIPQKQNEKEATYYSNKDRHKLEERSSWTRKESKENTNE